MLVLAVAAFVLALTNRSDSPSTPSLVTTISPAAVTTTVPATVTVIRAAAAKKRPARHATTRCQGDTTDPTGQDSSCGGGGDNQAGDRNSGDGGGDNQAGDGKAGGA